MVQMQRVMSNLKMTGVKRSEDGGRSSGLIKGVREVM